MDMDRLDAILDAATSEVVWEEIDPDQARGLLRKLAAFWHTSGVMLADDDEPIISRPLPNGKQAQITVNDVRLAGRLLHFGHDARQGCACLGCSPGI